MQLDEFDRYCRELLRIDEYDSIDASRNGLQVERRPGTIRKAAFAVDACMQSFEQAAVLGADLLFVHHGIFWGRDFPLTGAMYRRVRFLIEHDIALYAVHLPLDAHDETGNNIGMARELELGDLQPFGGYKGKTIGFRGILPRKADINGVLGALGMSPDECNAILPFGKAENMSVGIISGGSSRDVAQAIDAGLDLYISGEADHTIYHLAQENRINVIAAGHYASETWGVRGMAERIAGETGIETVFIDIPTGL
jgi:dinuclear metal center YbgI/SA1388 family protein